MFGGEWMRDGADEFVLGYWGSARFSFGCRILFRCIGWHLCVSRIEEDSAAQVGSPVYCFWFSVFSLVHLRSGTYFGCMVPVLPRISIHLNNSVHYCMRDIQQVFSFTYI